MERRKTEHVTVYMRKKEKGESREEREKVVRKERKSYGKRESRKGREKVVREERKS